MTKKTLFLAPANRQCGLTTVALGLVRAFDRLGIPVAFLKPIGQQEGRGEGPERSTHFVRATTSLQPPTPIPLDEAEALASSGQKDQLMSRVVESAETSTEDAHVVIVEGLGPTDDDSAVTSLNQELIEALGAEVILVAGGAGHSAAELDKEIRYAASLYRGSSDRLVGCILNRTEGNYEPGSKRSGLPVIGSIPDNEELTWPRATDVAAHLAAEVLEAGEIETRRVTRISLNARTVPNMLGTFTPGTVIVTPSDRDDVIIAVAMAALNHIPMAALVLTGDTPLDSRVMELCKPGFDTGLPVLRVTTNSYDTSSALLSMSKEVPADDLGRIEQAMDFAADHFDDEWLTTHASKEVELRMSPAAFCYKLTEKARAADKRILLPEGAEPRTIRAASICQNRGIARCVLIGDPEEIRDVAAGQGIELPDDLEIIDAAAARDRYVEPFYEMRKHKGLSRESAADQLTDGVVLGTMMLALGEADGLVSGAIHSTANTIRPALSLIKTKPDARVVSSVFFMCLPDQVLVYGDCAVNTDPDAETLADIAIQSAASAEQFGIPARVAMISYSTGESGSGADVDKVREATRLVRERCPDLAIDGPLQYDAAANEAVGRAKAPDSPVAGRATVFVFPDLNTGNTTYKAVQRSAGVISIGPMLQGMKRPVNDLSRGALIDDIVYTIALTAIQAADG